MQDIRDLVLHLAADAPPTSWVRVEVCAQAASSLVLALSFHRTPALSKKLSLS